MRIALIIAASAVSAVALAVAPALAEKGSRENAQERKSTDAPAVNPASMAPGPDEDDRPGDRSRAEAPKVNDTDRQFALLISMGGKAEIEQAQVAERKGSDPSVKDFARMMERDHSASNRKLKTVAGALDIPLSDKLNQEHQAALDRLEKTSSPDFDKVYMRNMVENHQKTVQLLEWVIGQGQNKRLQQFAVETLPVVLHHLEKARLTEAKVAGQSSSSEQAPSNAAKERRASDKSDKISNDRDDHQERREKKERRER